VTYYSLFDGGFLIDFLFIFHRFSKLSNDKYPPSHTYQHTYKAYFGRKSLRKNPCSAVSDDLVIFEDFLLILTKRSFCLYLHDHQFQ